MKQLSHKISRLIFEVSLTGDENQVKGLQSEIEQLVATYMEDALDQSFRSFSNEKEDFVIDKLEIDIGSFDLKSDKKKLFRTISDKVEAEIHKLTKTIEVQNGHSSVQSHTKDTSEIELVFYILRNGHLPWWANFDQKLNAAAVFKHFLQKPTAQQIVRLKDQLTNPVFRKRLIHYLAEVQLIECIRVLVPSLINSKKELIERCRTSPLFKVRFFELLFEIPNQENNDELEDLVEELIELLLDHKITPKLVNIEALALPKEVLIRLKSLQSAIGKSQLLTRKPNDSVGKIERKRKRSNRNKSTQPNAEDEIENSIEIGNAGLTLILSFLPRFFENIGIATGKGFNSAAEQHAAVYLLYYIATGSIDFPEEHELFFEKIICGIETEEVLMPFSEFRQSHSDEVKDLLQAVIENWKALKSSSPTTLQSAFLQRSGYLIQRDDGAWSLHIERQTIDILLDKLPWTISIARIPFSSMMIYTEW